MCYIALVHGCCSKQKSQNLASVIAFSKTSALTMPAQIHHYGSGKGSVAVRFPSVRRFSLFRILHDPAILIKIQEIHPGSIAALRDIRPLSRAHSKTSQISTFHVIDPL